ncbi:MAG: barstar family protein [Geminicoccaceae bacterium]|nr:barstar family protein [Geminicoccaceae bacterium]MCS7268018.1 barstar family protein [Geminicoccaceae bacterium]MCX7629791.1 barstar family protein [Geminicoccaceae bacterium]MDW8341396.1 barstar family protein [Geminicoccaceae bacterium]
MNPSGRSCRLDGRSRTRRAALARLARELGFPAHFGHNLDALYDVLTGDLPGPIEIVWAGADRTELASDPELGPLLRTLEAAARERPDLRLVLVGRGR